MGRGMSRAERLKEMERLYVQRAFSDIEMAERLGVDRTTVYKDRIAIETSVPFAQDERPLANRPGGLHLGNPAQPARGSGVVPRGSANLAADTRRPAARRQCA